MHVNCNQADLLGRSRRRCYSESQGINEALAGAEGVAQDQLRRLLHLLLDSPSGNVVEGDSAVIALLSPKDPSNCPLTHQGLMLAMTSFFDVLERECYARGI